MAGHHFLSYSSVDGNDFAARLRDALEGGHPPIPTWFDKRDIQPGDDWDESLAEALKTCETFLFIMTCESVEDTSVCKQEWTYALSCKKHIIPLKLAAKAEMPFRLFSRQHIDFTTSLNSDAEFNTALAKLRTHLRWRKSPAGTLAGLKERLEDAQRDFRRAADNAETARIHDEINLLKLQIAEQQQIVDDPVGVAARVDERIKNGLELERQPEKPVVRAVFNKFINHPPITAPTYFQNRHVETGIIGDFLKDDGPSLMTVVGRGGTGKTAMVCRLLKSIENGQLPDDGGPMTVEGIVYLSSTGIRRVTTANLFADLSKLLSDEVAQQLDALYKNPQVSTDAKMQVLLSHFNKGCTVLLLDNFEDSIDRETLKLNDGELKEALSALLRFQQHSVKVIITTRIAPLDLALIQPGRQRRLDLDEGLESPHAENILIEMDTDGKVGLKDAPADLLNEARIRTGGYPRALEALFAILSADRSTSLRDILNDTARLLPENVVTDLVGEAFNRLDTAAQLVMQALAVYGRPVTPAAIDFLLQPHLTGVNSSPVLNRLVNMKFARKESGQFARKESARFYLHPVDRAYAFGRIPPGEDSDRKDDEHPRFTQFGLLHRAAEYFKQARTPREQWNQIEDLAPQLAEFDLRFAGSDYETAATLLADLSGQYLFTWGFYRLTTDLFERLRGKLDEPQFVQNVLYGLGYAYYRMGDIQKAMTSNEQMLELGKKENNPFIRADALVGLGSCYSNLGMSAKAIEAFEQALETNRASGYASGEQYTLDNLGSEYGAMGQIESAIECYQGALEIARRLKDRGGEGRHLYNLAIELLLNDRLDEGLGYVRESIKIANETKSSLLYCFGYGGLATGLLFANDLAAARTALEFALTFDEPDQNYANGAKLGVVLIRQGDYAAARQTFSDAIAKADTQLEYSSGNYSALDYKGLALSGLALSEDEKHVPAAIEAYRSARLIRKDAGTVAKELRVFDELAKCDAKGVLAPVRKTLAGTP
jgi:tetratricopeptide (TPR) repeat protein